jgi:outer membrane cobalamin receptor
MRRMKILFDKMKRVGQLILPCTYLFFSVGAFAQSDTSKKLRSVEVQQSVLPKVQTIVPSQSVSASDFDRYNALNVADAIRDFAGVIIKDYGGIGGLKTISVRGLGANHTTVLFDGVALNDAENGQVDLSILNLNNVQRISLYIGQPPVICLPAQAFASASVLDITTIQPKLSAVKPFSVTAGIKGGSFGLINPYVLWQQRLSKNWSFIINSYIENANGRYKYQSAGDGTDSLRTRTNADISVQKIDGALYWAKSDSNKFNLHVNYYNSNQELPGEVILYNAAYTLDRLWNRDAFAQAGYERIWKNGFHLLLNTKLSNDYLRYLNPTYLNTEGRLDQQFTQRLLYQSAALAYQITKNWEVSYASDISVNSLNEQVNYAAVFNDPTRLTRLNVLASNFNVGRLMLQGSILNTNVSETVKSGTATPDRNVWSPTLIASIFPLENSNLQLRGFYKYIFRNPTFNDLYYGGIGNPNIKPEFLREFDLGVTYTKSLSGFFNYIAFTADAYYNKVTNKIVYIPKDAYNGSVQNFGAVDIDGLDVSVKTQGKLAEGWKASIFASYTYQLALNVTDPTSSEYLNQLPYTPKNLLTANAGVEHSHFGLFYNQMLTSSRYYNNENNADDYLPQYSLSDVSLVYHFLRANMPVTVSAEVNNIFNKSYVVVQSYPMPGRSFRLSFQITI